MAGKILGRGQSRKMGPLSLGPMLKVLGLKILIIEDEVAAARTVSRREPVKRGAQRFETHWRSRTDTPAECAETQPPSPVPLRVVQASRRGSKYG